MLGIGLVALPTGILSSGFIEKIQTEKGKEKSNHRLLPKLRI